MIYEENREQKYKDYVAVTQRGLLGILGAYYGADISLPQYVEYMYPETVKHETSEEIKSRIIKALT